MQKLIAADLFVDKGYLKAIFPQESKQSTYNLIVCEKSIVNKI